jgi:hypothetical protein
MTRAAQRGQAAVETVGIGVLVALLLSAVTVWLVREVRPPARPPALVEAVAQPLERPPGALERMYPLTRGFTVRRGRDDEPIGRVLRAIGRGAGGGAVLGLEARHRFQVALAMRLKERGIEFLRDPLPDLEDLARLPDTDILTPAGQLRRALAHAGELWDYARRLRTMPAREAAMTAAEDAGRVAADALIEVGQAALRRRVVRRGRPAPPPRRDAGGGPPAPSRTP